MQPRLQGGAVHARSGRDRAQLISETGGFASRNRERGPAHGARVQKPRRALAASRPHAREVACPRTVLPAAAGAARRSMRSTNLKISIPISSVLATPVAIVQSNNDSDTVWNAVCRNGT